MADTGSTVAARWLPFGLFYLTNGTRVEAPGLAIVFDLANTLFYPQYPWFTLTKFAPHFPYGYVVHPNAPV